MIKKIAKYDPEKIEPKWEKRWEKAKLYQAVDFSKKKKFYALVEFPYCSGEGLHLGHAFTNTIMDVFARKKRMSGFNVLHPMGWDAFGLPTENYAIKTGLNPRLITDRNTKRFKEQDIRLGLGYDWSREIDTSIPEYYKWTQWIFLQLFKHGLAYKKETPVGWCPACKIILANEEIVGGKCERCGTPAEHRLQKQWLLRITAYADRLIDDLDLVDYPDYVKTAQRNWIGRSEGAEIEFQITNHQSPITVFTTRPDTLFGVTAMVLAPEHPLVGKIVTPQNRIQVENYLEQAKRKSELERTELIKEKTGVFTGAYCLNPVTQEKVPIWIGDYVLGWYGGGAVMVVPAHDQRDFDFAKKYGLEVKVVIKPLTGSVPVNRAYEGEGVLVNSGEFSGQTSEEARKNITKWLEKYQKGRRAVQYKLRDWIFSRQHYWGEPIPMIYCPSCAKKGIKAKVLKGFPKGSSVGEVSWEAAGWFPVPEKDLPVELPKVEKYQPSETGESPLAKIKEWVQVACPNCGGPAQRETDTMPNWAGSSWYFLRYCDPKNKNCLADPKKLSYWLPVDLYLGGAEHTTLHLLYSRFWHKFLNDIGVAPGKEPYAARRQHGIILGEDGFKMSKSRGNIINPENVISEYGADTLRTYLMFMGPYEQTMPWNTKGVEGVYRFLKRVWQLSLDKVETFKTPKHLKMSLHQLIKKVSQDIDDLKFNTAIASMMEFVNLWSKPAIFLNKKEAKVFLQLLAPFAPHLSEELWVKLGGKFSIHRSLWPKYDPRLIEEEKVTLVVQVNGKLRAKLEVERAKGREQDEVEKIAKENEKIKKYLADRKIKKIIFVPGKLINFVV